VGQDGVREEGKRNVVPYSRVGGAPTLPDSSREKKPSHWFYVRLCGRERGGLRWWKSPPRVVAHQNTVVRHGVVWCLEDLFCYHSIRCHGIIP